MLQILYGIGIGIVILICIIGILLFLDAVTSW